ncbi:MAG: pyridoxamine 5'-phosphate oxidase family protein [Chloroflexota bacterium]|nr:pyridoxamine 5'-phosphate oxidase family protein [Chloroflexota bacterium]
MTALWYLAEDDGTITLNTYEDNVHVENIRRDGRVALLVDSSEQPYKSVHFNGQAEAADGAASAEEIARLYVRYLGDQAAATGYGAQLVSGGKRVNIRFTPEHRRSIDFGKLGSG